MLLPRVWRKRIALVAAGVLLLGAGWLSAQSPAPTAPTPLALAGIENAFDLGHGILSGGTPGTDAAFAELARRGVKTIVSVDGARPDLAAAHRAGLRYVHLPVGYDGIPAERARALAQLAATESGPLFVHCHHGRHRGPAAAAIIGAMRAGWDGVEGEAWLHAAGTSPDYPGLYESVRAFRRPALEVLRTNPVPLPEITLTAPLVDAMVTIDDHFDALKAARQGGSPDAIRAAVTLLLEDFRELARAETNALLRAGFTQTTETLAAWREAAPADAEGSWQRVTATCTDCHREHRNRPQPR